MKKNISYRGFEETCDAIVFDKAYAADVVFVTYLPNGLFRGDMPYGQGTIDMYGKNVKELVSEVKRWDKWLSRQ